METKTFEEAFRKFLDAGYELSEIWGDCNEESDKKVKQYPKYLPSFDDFLADFSMLLTEPEDRDKLVLSIVDKLDEDLYKHQSLILGFITKMLLTWSDAQLTDFAKRIGVTPEK